MFDKNIFVVNANDKEIFDKELSQLESWIYNYIKENKGISYEQCSKDYDKKFKVLNDLFVKYGYLSNIYQTKEVIDTYQHMIESYNKFSGPLGQNIDNYNFVKSVIPNNKEEEYLLKLDIERFEDHGLNLSQEDKEKLNNLRQELSKKSIEFNQNIVESKKEWEYILTDDIKETLSEEDLSYFEIIDGKYVLKFNQNAMSDLSIKSKSEKLREIIYNAGAYPASPKSNFDNTEVTKDILRLKDEIVKLLGHKNYVEKVLKDRMAKDFNTVNSFLENMKEKMKPLAKTEYENLNDFIKNEYGLSNVPKWSRAYYGNIKKEKELNYVFNMERPYFKKEKVYEGVFSLVNRLFGFNFIKDNEAFNLPYEDTDCFKVYEGDKLKSYLIVDMYERELKSSGAWVSGMESVTKDKVGLVSLCCNINKKDVGMDINEINTFLHEMGHAIHHFSSDVQYSDVAGTSGVARDAVEIPSQMLEQYAYDEEFLYEISSHIDTGEKIPKSMLNSIKMSKNYNIASIYARQLVFATYDINIYNGFNGNLFDEYKKIANSILPVNVDEDTNFPNTFSHIFSGGYSAGYYGYMWSDIYSIDAYMYIKENEETNARKFKSEVLSKGGSADALELYKNFRGSDADIENFLKYYGV